MLASFSLIDSVGLNDVKYGRHILALYEVSEGWLLAFTPVILSTIKLLYCCIVLNVE